jgi:hypothetical protein
MDRRQYSTELLIRVKGFVTTCNCSVPLALLFSAAFIAAGYNFVFLYLTTRYCDNYTSELEVTLCNHGMRVLSVLIFLIMSTGVLAVSSLMILHKLHKISFGVGHYPLVNDSADTAEWSITS